MRLPKPLEADISCAYQAQEDAFLPDHSAPMHSPHWDDLRFVLAVAEAGSLAGAARSLRVNHTTVLRRLGAYEARLGVRLFERLPTGYVPSPVGEAMIAGLREVDAAIHEVERRAAGHDLRLSGTVRLATTDTLMASLLPDALALVRKNHPGIAIEVTTANAPVVLTRREADIALRPTSAPPETLIGRRIASIGYALYAAENYLATRSASPLAAHAWIGPDDSLREAAIARWLRRSLPGLLPELRADSLLGLRELARAGLGVAPLPCYLGDGVEGLARLPGQGRIELGSALWLLTHQDLRRVARIDAVVRALADALHGQRARLEGVAA